MYVSFLDFVSGGGVCFGQGFLLSNNDSTSLLSHLTLCTEGTAQASAQREQTQFDGASRRTRFMIFGLISRQNIKIKADARPSGGEGGWGVPCEPRRRHWIKRAMHTE